jgi:hypothetical protein
VVRGDIADKSLTRDNEEARHSHIWQVVID